jgi:hypothetical protein
VTVADRIDSFRAWAPTVVLPDKTYLGKHRGAGIRALSIRRLFYTARHIAVDV